MKNGKCPMCNSTKIYTNPKAIFTETSDSANPSDVCVYDSDNEIIIYLAPYICINCGFIASFADDMDIIKDLPDTDGWEKVK